PIRQSSRCVASSFRGSPESMLLDLAISEKSLADSPQFAARRFRGRSLSSCASAPEYRQDLRPIRESPPWSGQRLSPPPLEVRDRPIAIRSEHSLLLPSVSTKLLASPICPIHRPGTPLRSPPY